MSKERRNSIRGGRRLARELIVQALYCYDLIDISIEAVLQQVEELNRELLADNPVDFTYFQHITLGVLDHLEEIDALILQRSENWSPERISVVDRNILRLGIYELMFAREIPEKVLINESIELSKRFGGEDSSRFVNGMMDRIAAQLREGSEP